MQNADDTYMIIPSANIDDTEHKPGRLCVQVGKTLIGITTERRQIRLWCWLLPTNALTPRLGSLQPTSAIKIR